MKVKGSNRYTKIIYGMFLCLLPINSLLPKEKKTLLDTIKKSYTDVSRVSHLSRQGSFLSATDLKKMQKNYLKLQIAVEEISAYGPEGLVQQDEKGNTPLHYAVKFDSKYAILFNSKLDYIISFKLMAAAMRFGASLDIKNHKGDTPLHYAAKKENPNIIKLLLETPVRIFDKREILITKSKNHKSPIYTHVPSTTRIEKTFDKDALNKRSHTPFYYARKKHNHLVHRAHKDKSKVTLLDKKRRSLSKECMKMLASNTPPPAQTTDHSS